MHISNKLNIVKNPNWQEADQSAIYTAWPRIWTRDYRETNPASDRVEALNPGPPDYNTSALNHSAMLLPLTTTFNLHILNCYSLMVYLLGYWAEKSMTGDFRRKGRFIQNVRLASRGFKLYEVWPRFRNPKLMNFSLCYCQSKGGKRDQRVTLPE